MRLRHELTVNAPLDRTWAALLDVERVLGSRPGATLERVGQDGLCRGGLALEAEDRTFAYEGTLRVCDADLDDHVVTYQARGREREGTGTADAIVAGRLEPTGETTRVVVETELNLTGVAARLAPEVVEAAAGRLLGGVAEDLQRSLQPVCASRRPGRRLKLGVAGATAALLTLALLARRSGARSRW